LNKKLIKKLSLFTVSLFTVTSLMTFSPVNKIYAAENTNTTNKIKGVITKYFKSEFESIKKGQAVQEDTIIGNEKLKEFINLRNSREGIWYKKLNYNLLNYSININYNSINYNDGICTIDLSKNTQFSYDRDPSIVSKELNAKHIITLKKIDDKWLIDNDIDNIENINKINKIKDSNSNSSNSNSSINNIIKISVVSDTNNDLDQKILNLKERSKNIDTEVNEYKQFIQNASQSRKNKLATLLPSPNGTFEGHTWQVDYNRMAAVNYAHTWANSQNNSYRSFEDDCANFVSQSIYAGAPVMNTGSMGWFNGTLIAGSAWINVGDQWNFLISNTGKGPVAMDNTHLYGIDFGDLIDLWNASTKSYHHAIIITKIGETGDLYFSAHTNSRYDYPLVDAYATGYYLEGMQRTAHILGYNN